jgi:hypothetical protein
LTSSDNIVLDTADGSSLFFSDYANCTYVYTGARGQESCSSTVLPTAADNYWMASTDGKAIVEKNDIDGCIDRK